MGRHFKIRTDHASLVWLESFKDTDSILSRWLHICLWNQSRGKLQKCNISRYIVWTYKYGQCVDCSKRNHGFGSGQSESLGGSEDQLTHVERADGAAFSIMSEAMDPKSMHTIVPISLLSAAKCPVFNWVGTFSKKELRDMQLRHKIVGFMLSLFELVEEPFEPSMVRTRVGCTVHPRNIYYPVTISNWT